MTKWLDHYSTSRDGLQLHCRDYPGPTDPLPLLLLHALTRNARDFEDVAARYAGSRRVIVPDIRGRGLSDRDPKPEHYAPPTYAMDVLQLLDELEIPRAIFVGTSLGGLVTMAVAAFAPKRIAAVALNDIGPELDPRGLKRIRGYVGKPRHFADWDEAAAGVAAVHGAAHPGYGTADWMRFARRVCREGDGGVTFDYDMAIAENFAAAETAPAVDGWPFFRALADVPLLILRGEHSDLLAEDVARRMVGEHADAELVMVPGVGHAPDLSEPEAIAALDRLIRRASA